MLKGFRKDIFFKDHAEMLEDEEAALRPGASDECYPRISCPECDLFFFKYEDLKNHRKEIHGTEENTNFQDGVAIARMLSEAANARKKGRAIL